MQQRKGFLMFVENRYKLDFHVDLLVSPMNLEDQLKQLEKSARKLDLTSNERKEYDTAIRDYLFNFLDELEGKNSWVADSEPSKEIYDFPITEDGYKLEDLLSLYERSVNSTGLQPASGGHLGYIPGGGVPLAGYGDLIAAITNKYSGVYFGNPGAIRLENHLIDWTAKQFGFTGEYGGNLTTGGSIGNLIAIVSARDAHNVKGKDYETTVIYGSSQMHHSLNKSIRIAGLGECIYRNIPLNENYHLDTGFLSNQIEKDKSQGLKPFLIIGSAGTTDTGVIDDLNKLSEISQQNNCWFHVDGAYGGYFYLINELTDKFKGIEKADSLVIDPHKGLFLPYGTGMVLVKNRKAMLHSHYYTANYMQDAYKAPEEWSPADVSPELSRNFRGLRMWLPLMVHGLKPFKDAILEKYLLTKYAYQKLKEIPYIEVGQEHELSVQTFRFWKENNSNEDLNKLNEKILEGLHNDGRIFISSTRIDDIYTLRFAILSFRTHKKEIDLILEMMEEQAIMFGLKK